jgi:hypothetical protein
MFVAAFGVGLGFVACASFSGSETAPVTSEAGSTNDANQPDAPDAFAADSSVDAGDAGPSDGTCRGGFGSPTLLLAHDALYAVDTATFTTDELDAFVTLLPANIPMEKRSVFAMHRAHVSDAFVMDTSQPLDLTEMGPTPGAFDVGLAADDLTLYFSHRQDPDAGGALAVDIYETARAKRGTPFAMPTKFAPGINNPTTNQFHAHPAGPNLYFTVAAVSLGVQGNRDLYVAPLNGGVRLPISELNTSTSSEANPVPSRDELEMFFSSDRESDAGVSRVYRTNRTSAALTFAPPNPVSLSVDAEAPVTPQHLSADRCRLYLIINQQDLYVVQRAAQ